MWTRAFNGFIFLLKLRPLNFERFPIKQSKKSDNSKRHISSTDLVKRLTDTVTLTAVQILFWKHQAVSGSDTGFTIWIIKNTVLDNSPGLTHYVLYIIYMYSLVCYCCPTYVLVLLMLLLECYPTSCVIIDIVAYSILC